MLRSLTEQQDLHTALLGVVIGCGSPLTADTLGAVGGLAEKTARERQRDATRSGDVDGDEGLVTADVHAALTARMPTLTGLICLRTLDDAARLMLATQACALALHTPAPAPTPVLVADEYTAGMLPSGFGVNAELIAALSDVTIPSGRSFDEF